MRPASWKQIRESLRQASPPVRPAPADPFWADFKARARMYPQQSPAGDWLPRVFVMRWALAAASVLVLAGLFLVGQLRPAADEPGNVIKSLDVIASHSAVLIMNDDSRHATILWVADMEAADGGDNT